MNKKRKRAAAVLLACALAVIPAASLPGQTAYAYTSLPYIEQIVADSQSGKTFNIVEITPVSGSGSMGYYIAGSEPFADDFKAALAQDPLGDSTARVSAAQGVFAQLEARGLIGTGTSTPLRYLEGKTAATAYSEQLPWETGSLSGLTPLTLGTPVTKTLKGTVSEHLGGGYSEQVTPAANGDRVQIIDYFVHYGDLADDAGNPITTGYYFYNPTFTQVSAENYDSLATGTPLYVRTQQQKLIKTDLYGSPLYALPAAGFVAAGTNGAVLAPGAAGSVYVAAADAASTWPATVYVQKTDAGGAVQTDADGNLLYRSYTAVTKTDPATGGTVADTAEVEIGGKTVSAPVYQEAEGEPDLTVTQLTAVTETETTGTLQDAQYQYLESKNDGTTLSTDTHYFYVSATGAPSAAGSAGAPYAAVSSDYRAVTGAETGYFTLTGYTYVGEGRGNYSFFADDTGGTDTSISTSIVYYSLGFTNNNWFLRYVFDRDDNYFSSQNQTISLKLSTVTPADVSSELLRSADLIVLSAGFDLAAGGDLAGSYGAADLAGVSGELAALAHPADGGTAVPVALDSALLAQTGKTVGTLAASLIAFDGTAITTPGVKRTVYCYAGPLASGSFKNSIAGAAADPAYADVRTEIEYENFLRTKSGATADLLPDEITQANCIRYILNYRQQRTEKTKSSITVLQLEPSSKAETLTTSQIYNWLGQPAALTNDDQHIKIVKMSTSEFIGKIDDLSETYDLIYLGGSAKGFNLSVDGTTVYNDTDMNGLVYTSIGDSYQVKLGLAGLLDSDYYYNYLDGRTTSRTMRFSGNDLTRSAAAALQNFAAAGYPIVCADDLLSADTTTAASHAYSVRLTYIAGSAGQGQFRAAVTVDDGTALSDGSTITYTLLRDGAAVATDTDSAPELNGGAYSHYFTNAALTEGTYTCTAAVTDGTDAAAGGTAASNAMTYSNKTTITDLGGGTGTDGYTFGIRSVNLDNYIGNWYTLSASLQNTMPTGATGRWTKIVDGVVTASSNNSAWTISVGKNTSTYYRYTVTFTYNSVEYSVYYTVLVTRKGNAQATISQYDSTHAFVNLPAQSDVTIGGTVQTDGKALLSITGGTYNPQSVSTNDSGWTYSTDENTWYWYPAAYSSSIKVNPSGTTYYQLYLYDWYNAHYIYSNILQVQPGGWTAGSDGTAGAFGTKTVTPGSVNKARIDANSNIYAALSAIWKPGTVTNVMTATQAANANNHATLLRYLNLSKPSIVWQGGDGVAYPTAYANAGGTMTQLAAGADGAYTLTYRFKIANDTDITPATTTYDVALYIDQNGDSQFRDKEKLTDIKVYDNSSGDARVFAQQITTPTGTRSVFRLKAGVPYTVTRQMPSGYAGIIPWKLQVTKNILASAAGGTAADTTPVHTSQINYTRIAPQEEQKTTIKILQIYKPGKINLEEQMNRTPYTAGQAVDQNLIGKDGKYYYTGVYGKLLADVDDFKITINSLSIDDINSAFNGASATPDAAAAAANSFADYDMLIIGFDDMYGSLGEKSANAIVSYISSNKAVLFTHDTTSLSNVASGTTVYYNSYNYNNTVNNRGGNSSLFPDYWGYYFNTLLRDAVSLDRYGITSTAKVTPDADSAAAAKTISSILRANTAANVDTATGAYKNAIAGDNYSIAYAPKNDGTAGLLSACTQGYTSYTMMWYPANNISQMRYRASTYSTDRTTNISQVNKGQITTYPYDINTSQFSTTGTGIGASSTMSVTETHNQYYQLNLNSDDIVVWYCLAANGSGSVYNDEYNDVLNAYYIYSKGNITYSGVGHTSAQSLFTSSPSAAAVNEAKLFVNTMVAAYRSAPAKPSAVFTSSLTTTSKLETYLVTSINTDTSEVLSGDYPLYFHLNDPSLSTGRKITLSFSFTPEGSDTAQSFTPVVCNESGAATTDYLGDSSYSIKLPQSLLTALGSHKYVTLNLHVGTDEAGSTGTDTSIVIRKVGLFDLE